MGLFGGLKWKNQQVRAGDPSEMRMDAMRYDDAGNLMPGGLIQGGETSLETLPGYYEGGDKFTGQDVVKMLLASVSDAGLRNRGHESNAMGNMNQFRLSAIEMAKKQAAEQEQQQALMEAARQRGINPADVTLAQGGLGGIIPKQGELPERARMAQWYQNASPQERAAFDQTNPIITNGYGSAVVPRNALPGGLDPNRYELIPDDEGGPTQPASGGFRPPRFRR